MQSVSWQITATSTVHEGTTDVYLGRGEDDPSVVFGRERLQISAAAACALRMVALSEVCPPCTHPGIVKIYITVSGRLSWPALQAIDLCQSSCHNIKS